MFTPVSVKMLPAKPSLAAISFAVFQFISLRLQNGRFFKPRIIYFAAKLSLLFIFSFFWQFEAARADVAGPVIAGPQSGALNDSPGNFQRFYAATLEVLKTSKTKILTYADDTYGKLEIRVDGVPSLSAEEVESLIPSGKSYYWWMANQASVIAALRQHPVIRQASIESCKSWSAYRCFEVQIQERTPTLWVKAEWEKDKEIRFLIADDGAVLSVLSADQQMAGASKFDRKLLARYSASSLTGLPVLDARNLANMSDASDQIFKRAVQLVSIIEEEAKSEVYEFRYVGNTEVEVEFESQPFTVVFNVNLDSSLNSRIAVQVKRLQRILNEKPLLASRAVSINLGLDREAYAVLAKG